MPDRSLQLPADLTVHARPRPTRYLWWGVAALAAFAAFCFFVLNPNWKWDVVARYLFNPQILNGVGNTLLLTLASTSAGLAVGIVLTSMRMSRNPVLRAFGFLYIWFVRATPALVALLFVYFASALLPSLAIGIPFTDIVFWEIDTKSILDRWSAAVIGLAFFVGGHTAEIIRGGLISVPPGQWEAGRAIGMSKVRTLRVVIVPQAIRVIIPPMANELITMFKNTSLVSVIGFVELLTTTQLIYSRTFETIPLLTVAVIWYLGLTSIAMIGQRQLEKRFGRGFDVRT